MQPTSPHPAPKSTSLPSGGPRRGFLGLLAGVLSVAAAALAGVPIVGYVIGRRDRKVHWVDLGAAGDFAPQETRLVTFDNPLGIPWDGVTAQTGVFVRYEGKGNDAAERFLVFAVNCAHLGCPVTWFPQSELFMCPCHGGVYYADGSHASGPPPRGLFHCLWRVRDGRLEIQAPHYPTLHDTLDEPARAPREEV